MVTFGIKFDARINGEQLLAERVSQHLGDRAIKLSISKDRQALLIDHDLVWNDAEILLALVEAVDDPGIFGEEIPRSEGWRYYRHAWSDIASGCDLDADYSAYHARKFLLEQEQPFDDIALWVLDSVRSEPASNAAWQKKEGCSFG